MALNCSMITSNNDPVPLPDEKIFLSVHAVTVSLTPTTLGSGIDADTGTNPSTSAKVQDSSKKGKQSIHQWFSATSTRDGSANGTIYVTNQRIIFIAQDAASLPLLPIESDSTPSNLPEIRTLTVPLANSHDGRFLQPWLSPNYHLSQVTPVPGGNLDQFTASAAGGSNVSDTTFTLKVVFNQGRGYEFYQALEEVKQIMFQSEHHRPADMEDLPTYSPPSNNDPDLPAFVDTDPAPGEFLPSLSDTASATVLPRSQERNRMSVHQVTMPDVDLLRAAEIALEEERQEREIMTEGPPFLTPDDMQSNRNSCSPEIREDDPPVYEA